MTVELSTREVRINVSIWVYRKRKFLAIINHCQGFAKRRTGEQFTRFYIQSRNHGPLHDKR